MPYDPFAAPPPMAPMLNQAPEMVQTQPMGMPNPGAGPVAQAPVVQPQNDPGIMAVIGDVLMNGISKVGNAASSINDVLSRPAIPDIMSGLGYANDVLSSRPPSATDIGSAIGGILTGGGAGGNDLPELSFGDYSMPGAEVSGGMSSNAGLGGDVSGGMPPPTPVQTETVMPSDAMQGTETNMPLPDRKPDNKGSTGPVSKKPSPPNSGPDSTQKKGVKSKSKPSAVKSDKASMMDEYMDGADKMNPYRQSYRKPKKATARPSSGNSFDFKSAILSGLGK